MSWTIAGHTVPNPYAVKGWEPNVHGVGLRLDMLDGSLDVQRETTRKIFRCIWRVSGVTARNKLLTALDAIHFRTGTVTDHLGGSETMTITEDIPYPDLEGTDNYEISATLEETTA